MFIIPSGSPDPDFIYHMASYSFWYITPLFHQDLSLISFDCFIWIFDPDLTYYMPSHSFWHITPLFHQDLFLISFDCFIWIFWSRLHLSHGIPFCIKLDLWHWSFTYRNFNPHHCHCITVSVLDRYTLVLSTAGSTTQWGWIRQQPFTGFGPSWT